MPDGPRLDQLLTKRFLKLIRDRIKAGVTDAEAKFRFNQDEEDALTGALAQSIAEAEPLHYEGPEGQFEFRIESHKLRGRGYGAPEKRLGADGILQISVSKNGKPVFVKGLPFQAKKFGGFANAAVKKQARDLYTTSESGIIVRYSDKGYTSTDVRHLLEDAESGAVPLKPPVEKLATMFGDRFLDCKIGRRGLTYDRDAVSGTAKGTWVINTVVSARG